MYSRQEASLIRKRFWTSFGQYMRPVKGAEGDTVNWLNYKTGIKHIYFRMDAGQQNASIAIELKHTDTALQQHYFEQLSQLRTILEQITGETWEWQLHTTDEDGNRISRISTSLTAVNIFKEADWPSIISFLKPRIMALDEFWMMVKEQFE
ncbi:MAG: DUF4268 domain-containing protein [Chitinophagales bacterium]|nr:DUF4268 domain-containing protein [Chitinophagales bacterium]